MFEVLYHPRSIKFIHKLPKKDQRRLLTKIEMLKINPFTKSLNVKKLATTKNSYRLRIGNLRAVFEIDANNHTIYINQTDFRGNIVY